MLEFSGEKFLRLLFHKEHQYCKEGNGNITIDEVKCLVNDVIDKETFETLHTGKLKYLKVPHVPNVASALMVI